VKNLLVHLATPPCNGAAHKKDIGNQHYSALSTWTPSAQQRALIFGFFAAAAARAYRWFSTPLGGSMMGEALLDHSRNHDRRHKSPTQKDQ